MIIDIHTHMPARPWKTVERILAEAKRLGIAKIVNLGNWPLNATPEQVVRANSQTMWLTRQRPDTFIGFCFLNLKHAMRFVHKEIARCVESGNLQGIKLECEVNARSPRLDPIMEICARLDVPLLHHAWYKTVGKVFEESDPTDIAHLAGRHPNTKIIMAHLTACGMRGVLDVQPYPNVFIDTSGSQPFSGIVEYAVEKLGAERILYGSDICGRDFASQLGRIYGAAISPRARDLILGGNAKGLLRL